MGVGQLVWYEGNEYSRVMKTITKPEEGEYPAYAKAYIDLLPEDGLVLRHMKDDLQAIQEIVRSVPERRLLDRYAEGKWTIKEVLVHVADTERVHAYRALRFARADSTELAGFDQDAYVRYAGANGRSAEDLLRELASVRDSTISLFEGLDDAAGMRSGIANGKKATVRAIAYMIAGHGRHHIHMIRERYMNPEGSSR